MKSKQLTGHVILITGASRGLGRALAIALAELGATIILMARTVPLLEQVYDEIVAQGSPEPAIYPLDLVNASPDDYREVSNRITNTFGRLDGIIHNAALLGQLTPIEHYDIKQWFTVMQSNINAPFLLTQALLPLLKQSNDARLLFTSANEGEQGKAYWGAYGVSKFALTGLAQTLQQELEETAIHVHVVNPGIMQTRLRSQAYPAEDPRELPLPESKLQPYLTLFTSRPPKKPQENNQSDMA